MLWRIVNRRKILPPSAIGPMPIKTLGRKKMVA
jgi:hypothetical protein